MTCRSHRRYPSGATEDEVPGDGGRHPRRSSENLLDQGVILDALAIECGQTILDAGCGNGYMAKAFARRVGAGGRVYALDPDEQALALLRAESRGTNIVALVGDITTATHLPASVFDLIYLANVFHIFSPAQIKSFEAQVKRLLTRRGKLAMVEIVKRLTPFGPPMNMRRSPEEMRCALHLASLGTVAVGEYFYMQIFEDRPGA